MMVRNMAIKSVGLFLLLSVISHSFADPVKQKKVLNDVIAKLEEEVDHLSKLNINVNKDVDTKVSDEEENKVNLPKDPSTARDMGEEPPSLAVIDAKLNVTDQIAPGSDILETREFKEDILAGRDPIKDKRGHWPKQSDRVPIKFTMSSAIKGNARKVNAIRQAVAKYKELSCIDWIEVGSAPTEHHVTIINDRGCYSYIGRVTTLRDYPGRQPISIGDGCGYLGTVEHEMLHALGFFHEQSRPDRDDHITIRLQNLANPAFANNFKKQSANTIDSAGQPYDIGSVMHYGPRYFNRPGAPDVIVLKNGGTFKANRAGFSAIDLLQLNAIYGCTATPKPTPKPTPGPGPTPGPAPGPAPATCEGFAKLGLCNYKFICDNCKKECLAQANQRSILVDIEGTAKCTRWKQQGFCVNTRFLRWMSSFCMLTCFHNSNAPDGECKE